MLYHRDIDQAEDVDNLHGNEIIKKLEDGCGNGVAVSGINTV